MIDSEYQTMKTKHLSELVTATQFDSFKQSASDLAVSYLGIDDKAKQPLHQLMPNFISFLENKVAKEINRCNYRKCIRTSFTNNEKDQFKTIGRGTNQHIRFRLY